jgi:preprotein translocase subunit SecE
MFNKIINYFKSVYNELYKVSWPKRKEVIYLTGVVILSVALAMGIVALIDLGLTKIINYLIY